jgi:hypothetical protein
MTQKVVSLLKGRLGNSPHYLKSFVHNVSSLRAAPTDTRVFSPFINVPIGEGSPLESAFWWRYNETLLPCPKFLIFQFQPAVLKSTDNAGVGSVISSSWGLWRQGAAEGDPKATLLVSLRELTTWTLSMRTACSVWRRKENGVFPSVTVTRHASSGPGGCRKRTRTLSSIPPTTFQQTGRALHAGTSGQIPLWPYIFSCRQNGYSDRPIQQWQSLRPHRNISRFVLCSTTFVLPIAPYL